MAEYEEIMMPNAAMYVLLKAVEDVMGTNGLKAVLNGAKLTQYIDNFPPNNTKKEIPMSTYGAVEQAIEDFYGPRGARAMLQRIGRTTYRYTMEEQPAILGLAGAALKMLPQGARVKLILGTLATASGPQMGMPMKMDEEEDKFIIDKEACPCMWRPKADKPSCYGAIGVFQEALQWATGKRFTVTQTDSFNTGSDVCRYEIKKTPEE